MWKSQTVRSGFFGTAKSNLFKNKSVFFSANPTLEFATP